MYEHENVRAMHDLKRDFSVQINKRIFSNINNTFFLKKIEKVLIWIL